MAKFSRSFVSAVECMVFVAILYEPMRMALHSLKDAVGGVGGVGGLVNLGDPSSCSSLASKTENYCFVTGVFAGLTPMALIVLAAWTLPLLLAALSTGFTIRSPSQQPEPEEVADDGSSVRFSHDVFARVWAYIAALWFVVPFGAYIMDPFYRQSLAGVILAVAIAAAFPCSWHLAFVAFPISEAVSSWLGLPRSTVVAVHKTVGWGTVVWAAVHAGGEMVWLLKGGLWHFLKLSSPSDGENMLYIFGIVTAVTMAAHAVLAYVRKQQWIQPNFKIVHRVVACLLLLFATTHWWPFALFLLPTAAAHGCIAGETLGAGQRPPSASWRCFAFAAALVAAFVGLAVVWTIRAQVMQHEGIGLVLPFIFPPLALLAEGGAATLTAFVCIWASPKPGSETLSPQLLG
mmetsp:Transcript_19974/g.46479  ORF Transcript_19974/g.46479 Transcript_19974/m.46479 type:complete len:403 (+) Transcript_19974:108-1316(+)